MPRKTGNQMEEKMTISGKNIKLTDNITLCCCIPLVYVECEKNDIWFCRTCHKAYIREHIERKYKW